MDVGKRDDLEWNEILLIKQNYVFSVTCSYVCVYIFTVLVYFPKYCSWNCVSVGYIESHDILMYI